MRSAENSNEPVAVVFASREVEWPASVICTDASPTCLPAESRTLPWMVAPVALCEGTCCAIAMTTEQLKRIARGTTKAPGHRAVPGSARKRDLGQPFTDAGLSTCP